MMYNEADAEDAPLLGNQVRTTKHDRLLHNASDRLAHHAAMRGFEDEGSSHHVAARMLLLTCGSCACFAAALLAVTRFYHKTPMATLFVNLQLFAAGTALSILWTKQRWHRWLGRFLIIATCAGTVVGLYIYYSQLLYYYSYMGMKASVDASASSPPILFSDSGMIQFTSDTRLDVAQSVGYRSAVLGATLCVAPIVDGWMGATDEVSFFAAGVDCCSWRSRFQCGDAMDLEARSGLLHLSPRQLVTPLMEWAVEDPALLDGFEKAVKLQASVFGSAAARSPRFLRWVADPREQVDLYFQRALQFGFAAGGVFLVASVAAALVAALGRHRIDILMAEVVDAWADGQLKVRKPRAPPQTQFRRPVDALA